jgi:hypothetical protein
MGVLANGTLQPLAAIVCSAGELVRRCLAEKHRYPAAGKPAG